MGRLLALFGLDPKKALQSALKDFESKRPVALDAIRNTEQRKLDEPNAIACLERANKCLAEADRLKSSATTASAVKDAGEYLANVVPSCDEALKWAGEKKGLLDKAKELFTPKPSPFEQLTKLNASYLERRTKLDEWLRASTALQDADEPHSQVAKCIDDVRRLRRDAEALFAAAGTEPAPYEQAIALLATAENQCAQAERAAAEAKRQFNLSVAKQEEWKAALAKAEAEHQRVAKLPGAETVATQLAQQIEIAKSQTQSKNGVLSGCHLALEKLRGFEKLVGAAEQAHALLAGNSQTPLFRNALQRTRDLLPKLERVAPSMDVLKHGATIGEIETALQRQVAAAPDAQAIAAAEQVQLKSLVAVEIAIETDITQWKQLQGTANTELAAVAKELDSTQLPKSLRGPIAQQLAQADRFCDRRDWEEATRVARAAQATLRASEAKWQPYAQAWQDALAMKSPLKALGASPWPPLSTAAVRLTGNLTFCEELLPSISDDKGLEDLFKKLANLRSEFAALQTKFEKLPQDPTEQAALAEALQLAIDAVKEKRSSAWSRLTQLEFQYQPVVVPGQAELRNKFNQTDDDWTAYVQTPELTLTAIATKRDHTLRGLNEVEQKAVTLLETLPQDFNLEDAQRKAGRPAVVEKLLSELAALAPNHPSLAESRKSFAQIQAMPAKEAKDADAQDLRFQQLAVELEHRLSSLRHEHATKLQAANKQRAEVAKSLDKVEPTGYRQVLLAELDDAQRMLDSGDPELFAIAEQITNDLAERARAEESNSGVTFQQVKAKWAALSNRLDNDEAKKQLVDKRLPDTHKRLRQELIAAIALAQKSRPSDGWAALEKLEPSIEAAVARAWTVHESHAELKARVAQVDKDWSAAKDKATTFFESAGIMNEEVKTLKKEIESQRHTETEIQEAWNTLLRLEALVARVNNSSDPRATLQELTAERQRETDRIKAQAKQFRAVLTRFKDQTLPETKATLEAKFKDGTISEVDWADHQDTLSGLKKNADAAAKVVAPYLDLITANDLTRWLANNAPNVAQAAKNFATANQMLNDSAATATRLLTATITTNRNVTGDLLQVQKEWGQQVGAFTSAVDNVVSAITSAVSELQSGGQLPPESLDELREQSEQAKKLIRESAALFKANDFDGPFRVLVDTQADPKAKLAAREAMLKRVHAHLELVLKHPVLLKLTAKTNPFDQAKLLAAKGYLRSALQRIELETLTA